MNRKIFIDFLEDYRLNPKSERLGQAWINRVVSKEVKEYTDPVLFYEANYETCLYLIETGYVASSEGIDC